MRKPETKRKIVLFAYWAVMSLLLTIPKSGKRTMGRKAVTTRGIISVSHKVAIQIAMARVWSEESKKVG